MFTTAFLDLAPLEEAGGTVALPGSKSISNRVLLLAALSGGMTVVHDLLDSDDTRVMLDALRALGCSVVHRGAAVEITGIGKPWVPASAGMAKPAAPVIPAQAGTQGVPGGAKRLFLGNAGTAMRPLTAALALLGGEFEVSGIARMHERPIGDLVDALRQLGCRIDYLGKEGYPPLRIHPATALQLDAPIQVRGDVSSQFLTALLMALPLVAARDIVIEVVGELISKPYIEITLNMLERFGIAVRREGWQRFTIPAGSQYRSPGEIHVEADASSASYFVALGALAATTRPVRIEGVGAGSIQGDIRFIEAAQRMGAAVTGGPNWLEVTRGAWPLRAIDLDCNHIPDAAMTLAVMALYADGTTTLRNIASWRVKETDRLAAMAAELRKLGAQVEEGADFLRVAPPASWRPASIHTYDDHRMAMCFALAAFNPSGVHVRIEDPQCVGKTFPDFFEALFSVSRTSVPHIPV
ncbi:MAG TPA: 3-phosphoshikimate 1-carboxyvinyltransferase, partial [Ramlibacter sp.]